MSSLPASIRQFRVALGSQVESGKITDAQAGQKLAVFLREKYPAIYDSIVVQWCTARFRKYNPLPDGWEQTSLWPVKLWHRPLADAVEYAKSQKEMTHRFAVRDGQREQDLVPLIAAVGGDLSVTLEDAYQLAYPNEATG